MGYESLSLERREGVGILTLNRPQKLNALNRVMARELIQVCDDLESDPAVRAVVVTGAGRAFSAGGDIQDFMVAMAPVSPGEKEAYIRLADLATLKLKSLEKPVVAAVNGVAVGGGCCIAMACDIRIASQKAQFGLVFVNRGLSGADMGATWLLPCLVGAGKAYELLLTGDIIDAREAERIGLVNYVVAPEDVLERAWEMARKLVSGPPLGLKMTKRALNHSIMGGLASHLDYEAALQAFCFQTQDHQEGVRSFLEKREAVFKGQ